MAINETQLDVHFLPVNQQAPNSSAPAGRLARLRNSVADQFEGQNLKISQRQGFRQLPKKVINPDTASVLDSGFAETPELMSSLERQLLVVADCHPYSYAENADEWSRPDYVLHANSPRQRPIYTSNTQIVTPDSACVGNVVCYVWKETNQDGLILAKVMVRDLDGTVILSPRGLAQADPEEDQTLQIKVISDGSRFWVFYSATTSMLVSVILPDGTFSGFSSFATLTSGETWNFLNAFWDVQFNVLGPSWFGQTFYSAADHTSLYTFSWAPGTITPTRHDYTATILHLATKPFWLTNPYDTNSAYIGIVSDTGTDTIYVEKINSAFVRTTEYAMASGFNSHNTCEATGYVDQNGDIGVLLGVLDTTSAVFNYTSLFRCSAADAHEPDEVLHSITPASRCFFLNGRPTCAMYFTDGVQPTFFLHDMRTEQMVGCWSHGSGAQDWQGTPGVDNFLNYNSYCVPSWYTDDDGNPHCGIGFLAESFARNTTTYTRTGLDPITSIVTAKFVSCVGLADFELSKPGVATEYADELMIPGPQSTCFTGMLYTEDNFNLFPSPITLTPSYSDAGLLTPSKTYSISVVFESTDTRGNRIKSRPSDPQSITLTSGQNILTITGPTLFETFGKSNVMISIYSTFIDDNGVISTDHSKITDDLVPLLNDKSSTTWTFFFNKSSEDIQVGEVLYTDNGLLPHDACPAHSVGCIAGNRMIVAGYDGALWYSNEKIEGEPLTFNLDVLRVLMPTSDKIKSMKALDTMRVIVQCERTQWEFDISALPGPDGLNGNVQSPKQLPFTNGSTGFAAVVKEGILYSSSAAGGGAWLVTRGLENIQIGAPEYSDFIGTKINGMATNDGQRTMFGIVNDGVFRSYVRDGLNACWYEFVHPRKINLVHVFNGHFAYADDISVHVQDYTVLPFDTYKNDGTGLDVFSPIAQDIVTVPINFGQIKGMKCVWKFILNGQTTGTGRLLIDCDYKTEDGTFSEAWVIPITDVEPIELAFEPQYIEMSAITIRIRSEYLNDVSAYGFDLDSITFVVGIDSYPVRTPSSRTPLST